MKRVLTKAKAHLSRHPKLRLLVKRFDAPAFEEGRDPFEALCRAIVGQQLSVKAAATIYARFRALYKKLTPAAVLKSEAEELRSVGLSKQKISYLKDLAMKFSNGTVSPKKFHTMSDDEVRAHLIAVKGVGVWTADMFLMFTLHRLDVLPTGDLGIQKGMQKLFNLRTVPSPEKMKQLAIDWHPYRTVACRYIWMSLENE